MLILKRIKTTLLAHIAASSARAAMHQPAKLHQITGISLRHASQHLYSANLYLLLQNRQALVGKQLMLAAVKRNIFDCQPGQKVLQILTSPSQLHLNMKVSLLSLVSISMAQ